jgi:hypothetical protein
MDWSLGRFSSGSRLARKSLFREREMARSSSETVLQLGPRTLAGLELALTKDKGVRLPQCRSAGKISE